MPLSYNRKGVVLIFAGRGAPLRSSSRSLYSFDAISAAAGHADAHRAADSGDRFGFRHAALDRNARGKAGVESQAKSWLATTGP